MGDIRKNLLTRRNVTMKQLQCIRNTSLIMMLGIVLMSIGCAGPSTFTRTRIAWEPYSQNESKQTNSGITIERYDLKELPPEFYATIQDCDPKDGKLYIDSFQEPVMKKIAALPKNSVLEKIAITNNTGHIVRLNTTVITAFDPADNQYDILTREQIASYLMQERPCSNTSQLANQLNLVKFIDRNTELLPNRTTTGDMVYKAQDVTIPGVWKLTFYELPVETNSAGAPTKTINFDFRTVCKKYQDTYRRDSTFADAVKVSTEEIK
jgi:hypothetical protein